MASHARRRGSAAVAVVTVLAELLLTFAAVCGLYIAWMEWWTGVESEHAQLNTRTSVSWADSVGTGETGDKIAQPQEGDAPVQPETASDGELIGLVYIPRFGDGWERNLVQGTSLKELNLAGLGHYTDTQMPGAVGNFAIAGHRNGYGQPLGDIDLLEPGDAIVVRTEDYWYVYKFTSYKIVLANDSTAIVANPEDPGAEPTKRMITLTTCEPKYSTPTHRWISYGELEYWAKASDGIPAELAQEGTDGTVTFAGNDTKTSVFVQMGSMKPLLLWTAVAYAIIFIAAAIAWGWPLLRRRRESADGAGFGSGFYGWLVRHQPGPGIIRWVLTALLAVLACAAMFQWVFPWLAGTVPFLREMSNYTVY